MAERPEPRLIPHLFLRTPLSRGQACMPCSLAGDLRVTQTVDGVKGCHMMLAKAALSALSSA
jgi:acetamidase/formamidase